MATKRRFSPRQMATWFVVAWQSVKCHKKQHLQPKKLKCRSLPCATTPCHRCHATCHMCLPDAPISPHFCPCAHLSKASCCVSVSVCCYCSRHTYIHTHTYVCTLRDRTRERNTKENIYKTSISVLYGLAG